MTINWYGEGCFKIQEGGVTIITDPIDASSGLSTPRSQATVTLKTLLKTPTVGEEIEAGNTEENNVIAGPGEYEVQGVVINGWALAKDSDEGFIKSVFQIKIEDLTIGLLGHISAFNEPEILEELGKVDILIMPAGGAPFIEQAAAAKLVRQINPTIIIPSFFKVPKLKRKADPVDAFLKELGMKGVEPQEKFTAKKKDLTGKTQVVVLSA